MDSAKHIAQLTGLLQQLIVAGQHGDWDAVVDLQPQTVSMLSDLGREVDGKQLRSLSPAQSEHLRELQKLIDQASTLCSSRRDQIAPLVNQLAANRNGQK